MSLRRWLRDRPALLERAYRLTGAVVRCLHPLIRAVGYRRAGALLTPLERVSKRALFDCRMCGQCILHSTGMVCPMTCPKNLRNGACGGVRGDGGCEVVPEMKCVWVEAFEKAREMRVFGPEIISIQPPVDHRLEGSSAWINLLAGDDARVSAGWRELPAHPAIEKKFPAKGPR